MIVHLSVSSTISIQPSSKHGFMKLAKLPNNRKLHRIACSFKQGFHPRLPCIHSEDGLCWIQLLHQHSISQHLHMMRSCSGIRKRDLKKNIGIKFMFSLSVSN